MPVRIDDKEQVFSSSFIVHDDQEAVVSVPIPGADPATPLKLSVVFTQPEKGSAESRVPGGSATAEWTTEAPGVMRIKFIGWNNPLGTAVTDPQKFAEQGRRKLYFQVAHWRLGEELNLVHLYLFLEVPDA